MVAYSFKPIFEAQIASGAKSQTVRNARAGHVKPGGVMQFYTGMRTKACRKIRGHAVCTRVCAIEITVNRMLPELIASIAIEGVFLRRDEIEAFAVADGFAPDAVALGGSTARENMGRFWLTHHGAGWFEGVVIEWECEVSGADSPSPPRKGAAVSPTKGGDLAPGERGGVPACSPLRSEAAEAAQE
jgi:hypothetical protein